MQRAILSSTQITRYATTSRRLLTSATRNNTVSSFKNTSKRRSPFFQQQKNKSTLGIQQQRELTPTQQFHQLSKEQVSSLFWSAAIPMVGFGFMDNFIMITAGSAIDQTLGVQLGLATMTAAAIGQVVSDVSGVLFGDTLANWFNVAPANLSKAQSQFKVVNRIKLGGAVAGMIVGCTLGAVALWIVPEKDETASPTEASLATQQHERRTDQLHRLQQVMTDIMTSPDEAWHDLRASCTLYVNESLEDSIPSDTHQQQQQSSFFDLRREQTASIQALAKTNDPEVKHTLKEGRVVVFENTIYVPVLGSDKAILGIFKIKLDNGSFFPPGSDIKNAKAIARNIGFFLNRML